MQSATLGEGLLRRFAPRSDSSAVLGVFTATLFLSALLLFSVQPMFAKMVLPRLGGAPSVWAVSMCFFQAVLLAGYCYAHALNRYLSPRLAPFAHLSLLGVALLALPIGLSSSASEPPAGDAYLWLIWTLGVGVGLPFFAISANAPLLQSWFARTKHRDANDPYFLYGASNLGSLAALLAYPFLVEPFVGVASQTFIWTIAFVVLGLGIAGCGFMLRAEVTRTAGSAPVAIAESEAESQAASQAASMPIVRPTTQQRLSWIGLAAVPSGLLVAYTSYVTTDIASAPFLWVLPLAAFLATFILAFTERPPLSHSVLLTLQPALVGASLYGLATPGSKGWLIAIVASTGAFFVTTMVAHRELYLKRPASAHLTEFYLWMSLGGVLGGMFAALLSPRLFNSIWEFPLLLVLGMACRPGLVARSGDRVELRDLARLAAIVLIVMCCIGTAMRLGVLPPIKLPLMLLVGGFAALAVLASDKPLRQFVYACLMGLTLVILPSAMNRGAAERSFFGVHYMTMTPDDRMRLLMHGTTIHGAERLVDTYGKRVKRPVPSTYYYPGGPMARGVDAARVASGKLERGLKVGVVGLGAGSMACHSRPDESWRFFEIDPVVVKIARDSGQFSFLAHCQLHPDIVVGDARLTIAKEAAGTYDYLIIDAFASDSVPVHLMTIEALQLYLSRLAPHGILAMHVSNRHLDLVTVLSALVQAVPGTHAMLADDRGTGEENFDQAASQVVFFTKDAAAMQPVRVFPYMTDMPATTSAAWTDDYSNIISAMWRKYR